MKNTTEHRIIYADTDFGGVVYYARYLEFLEAARSELVRKCGKSVAEYAKEGHIAPVVSLNIEYKAPAKYDNILKIETEITKIGHTSITFKYKVFNKETLVLEAKTVNVFVDKKMKPVKVPEEIRKLNKK